MGRAFEKRKATIFKRMDRVGKLFTRVGKEISIADLADLIRELAGSEAPVEHDDSRLRPEASEVDRLCSDPSRARERIGWAPRCPLRKGLHETIEWIRERGARERVEEFVL